MKNGQYQLIIDTDEDRQIIREDFLANIDFETAKYKDEEEFLIANKYPLNSKLLIKGTKKNKNHIEVIFDNEQIYFLAQNCLGCTHLMDGNFLISKYATIINNSKNLKYLQENRLIGTLTNKMIYVKNYLQLRNITMSLLKRNQVKKNIREVPKEEYISAEKNWVYRTVIAKASKEGEPMEIINIIAVLIANISEENIQSIGGSKEKFNTLYSNLIIEAQKQLNTVIEIQEPLFKTY